MITLLRAVTFVLEWIGHQMLGGRNMTFQQSLASRHESGVKPRD